MMRSSAGDPDRRDRVALLRAHGAAARPMGSGRVAVLLSALALAVYANALNNPLMIDDEVVIAGDPRVVDGQFGALCFGNFLPPPAGDLLYRPLVKLSLAVNWFVSRQPWTFRLLNVLLHAGVGVMVFLLGRDLFGLRWGAVAAAVLFVVHPINTEVLNVIVSRADLGAAFFGLLALWLYSRDGGSAVGPAWRPLAIATLAFAAALLCKENAVTVVGAVLLVDAARHVGKGAERAGIRWRRRALRCYLPMLLVVAAYLAGRYTVLGALTRDASAIHVVDNVIARPDYGLAPGDSVVLARWATPLVTFALAAKLLVIPAPLCWDYSYATIETVRRLSDVRLWVGIGCVAATGLALILSWRRRRQVFLALGLGLVAYSIVSNVPIVIGTIFAERLLYLPSVGFCLLVGLVVGRVVDGSSRARRGPVVLTAVALGGVVGVLAYLTIDRNGDWRSRAILDARDLAKHPRAVRLLCSVAYDALADDRLDEARARAKQAIAIEPRTACAWQNLGLAYYQQGDHANAETPLRTALTLGATGSEQVVMALADILVARGEHAAAIRLLGEHVARYPLSSRARNNLAWNLLTAEPAELRDPPAALRHARDAYRRLPDEWGVADTFAAALAANGERREAERVLRETLALLPPGDPNRRDIEARLEALTRP